MASLTAVLQQLRDQIGIVRDVVVDGDTATITTDTRRVNSFVSLDGDGRATPHTVALQMIAEFDNTATDLLMDLVGWEGIAAVSDVPDARSTREFFVLKADASAAIGPHNLGIERYLSFSDLCAILAPLADLPLMQVNPGPVPALDRAQVAYKGGSESGVRNFTSFLRDQRGRSCCVTLGVNDPDAIALETAVSVFQTLLYAVADAP